MERKSEDNTVFVLQKAIRYFKIKVTNSSIREFLLANPHYPSLKSVCDALKKWGIEYYALKLEKDEINDLKMPFIAHLKTSWLFFVKKIKNGDVQYSSMEGKNNNETFTEFAEKLSGAVIVLKNCENAGEKEYKQIRQNEILNKIILPVGIFTVLLFGILSFLPNIGDLLAKLDLIFCGLIITKITGIVASLLLIMHEFKIHSPLADKICGFNSKTDCEEVLASNASRLFGWFNWADAGLIYFIGTLIYLLGSVGNSSLGFLAMISLLSLPYPIFSIYYQSIKLKKWCPFCVLVQIVLIAEFILLFPVFKIITFSVTDALKLINSFFIPAALWLIYKAYYSKLIDFKRNQYLFLQFKRNPEIFTFLLKNNGYYEFPETKNSLILGSPDATITVTVFLSLYCNPCAKAFKRMKALLDNCPQVKINTIFTAFNDEETQKIINTLYYINAEKGSKTTLDFLDKWYSLPKGSRKPLYNKEIIPKQFNIAQQISDENKQLFDKFQITGTPTIFVNGYLFPNLYQHNEIENYIEIIKQLTRENKRQEACTIST
jgi:uncharacterized membrane protein